MNITSPRYTPPTYTLSLSTDVHGFGLWEETGVHAEQTHTGTERKRRKGHKPAVEVSALPEATVQTFKTPERSDWADPGLAGKTTFPIRP